MANDHLDLLNLQDYSLCSCTATKKASSPQVGQHLKNSTPFFPRTRATKTPTKQRTSKNRTVFQPFAKLIFFFNWISFEKKRFGFYPFQQGKYKTNFECLPLVGWLVLILGSIFLEDCLFVIFNWKKNVLGNLLKKWA